MASAKEALSPKATRNGKVRSRQPGARRADTPAHAGSAATVRRRARDAGDEQSGLPPPARRLVEHPTYLQADEDLAFLRRPEMCGVRLQLDYWKAEETLQRHDIHHTVVVYGSTRIPAPDIARRRLRDARRALREQPGARRNQQALQAAARLLALSRYYDVARELGRIVGGARNAGALSSLAIMTGGGPGIMEAANRGAHERAAPSIGLNIALPHKQQPNPYITPDLCFRFHYFAIRKLHLLERAQAAIFFPGGFGTCDELFEVLTLLQTKKIRPLPVVLVGKSYWRRAIDFDFMVTEGMISADDAALFVFRETAEDIWSAIVEWHASHPSAR
ncbi:LOG family protein [Paraburkholderia sp. ZP32-5]|uniref:LOG family protein n=1 Tax=Paraburkholderia sp. ZP32-5 TaxID=2883245 RepID=UPI001F44D12F|nr:LOG family protein [Paraburkholderia sp. ZP32-5]